MDEPTTEELEEIGKNVAKLAREVVIRNYGLTGVLSPEVLADEPLPAERLVALHFRKQALDLLREIVSYYGKKSEGRKFLEEWIERIEKFGTEEIPDDDMGYIKGLALALVQGTSDVFGAKHRIVRASREFKNIVYRYKFQ